MVYAGPAAIVAIALKGIPRFDSPEIFAILTGAWALATRFWTVDAAYTLTSSVQYAAACLIFLAVRHVVTTRRQLIAVGCAFLVGAVMTARTVMEQASSAVNAVRASTFDYSVRFSVDNTENIEAVDYNYTAYIFVTATLIAITLIALRGQALVLRLCLLACLPLLAYGVILNGTKGATISLILAALYLPLSLIAPRRMYLLVSIATPALLVLVPLGLFDTDALLWLDSVFGRETGSLSGRLDIWPAALASWLAAPIIGIGAAGFPALHEVGPHTLFLTLGNDLGLIGILLYAAVFATAAIIPAARSTPSNQRLAGLLMITMLPIWLTGHWETAKGVFLLLGLLSVMQRPEFAAPVRHRRPGTWPAARVMPERNTR